MKEAISTIVRYEVLFVLSAFFLAVLWKFFSGMHVLNGFFRDRSEGRLDPSRVQECFITLSLAIYYLILVIEKGEFVPVEGWMLGMVLGSNGIYLYHKRLFMKNTA